MSTHIGKWLMTKFKQLTSFNFFHSTWCECRIHIITFLYCSLSVKIEKFAELGKNSDKARSYHKLLLKLSSNLTYSKSPLIDFVGVLEPLLPCIPFMQWLSHIGECGWPWNIFFRESMTKSVLQTISVKKLKINYYEQILLKNFAEICFAKRYNWVILKNIKKHLCV